MTFDLSEATQSVQGMVSGFIQRLPYLGLGLVVFLLFLLIAWGARRSIRALTARSRRHNLGLVLGRLSQALLILVGLLIALVIMVPGFTPGELIGFLGIGSVAIGFAFRDILQNFLAGILLLLTEPFQIDDQIVIQGYEGTVEEIQTRATLLKTYDGRRVVIPNSDLFTSTVVVNTAYEQRRVEYDIGIGFGDDIDRAKQIMLETVRQFPTILAEPAPDALVVALAESSVNIRLRWWIKPPRRADALETQDQVLAAVKQALQAVGIDLPFPTRQILFHDQTEEGDGDRTRQREGWPRGQNQPPRQARTVDALRQLAHQDGNQFRPAKNDS